MRVMFRCRSKSCGHVWAVEYPHKVVTVTKLSRFPFERRSVEWFRDALGRHLSAEHDMQDCPTCGSHHPDRNRVKGVVSEHVCDARCTGATGHSCECSCGGANHGRDHLMTA